MACELEVTLSRRSIAMPAYCCCFGGCERAPPMLGAKVRSHGFGGSARGAEAKAVTRIWMRLKVSASV